MYTGSVTASWIRKENCPLVDLTASRSREEKAEDARKTKDTHPLRSTRRRPSQDTPSREAPAFPYRLHLFLLSLYFPFDIVQTSKQRALIISGRVKSDGGGEFICFNGVFIFNSSSSKCGKHLATCSALSQLLTTDKSTTRRPHAPSLDARTTVAAPS